MLLSSAALHRWLAPFPLPLLLGPLQPRSQCSGTRSLTASQPLARRWLAVGSLFAGRWVSPFARLSLVVGSLFADPSLPAASSTSVPSRSPILLASPPSMSEPENTWKKCLKMPAIKRAFSFRHSKRRTLYAERRLPALEDEANAAVPGSRSAVTLSTMTVMTSHAAVSHVTFPPSLAPIAIAIDGKHGRGGGNRSRLATDFARIS